MKLLTRTVLEPTTAVYQRLYVFWLKMLNPLREVPLAVRAKVLRGLLIHDTVKSNTSGLFVTEVPLVAMTGM